jgi:hypothetical protein
MTDFEREILLAAKDKMGTHNIRSVCTALEAGMGVVFHRHPTEFCKINDAYSRVRDFVGRQIHPYVTLGCWQEAHGFERTREQRRRDRINWIRYMLGELE